MVLNPDGRMWIDRLTDGRAHTGKRLTPADGKRLIRLVAHRLGAEVPSLNLRVFAELPGTGKRFQALEKPPGAAAQQVQSPERDFGE